LRKIIPDDLKRRINHLRLDLDARFDSTLFSTFVGVRELYERAPEPKSFATIDSDHTYAGERARVGAGGRRHRGRAVGWERAGDARRVHRAAWHRGRLAR